MSERVHVHVYGQEVCDTKFVQQRLLINRLARLMNLALFFEGAIVLLVYMHALLLLLLCWQVDAMEHREADDAGHLEVCTQVSLPAVERLRVADVRLGEYEDMRLVEVRSPRSRTWSGRAGCASPRCSG